MDIFLKITQLLAEEQNPPTNMFGMGIWLGRVLGSSGFAQLNDYERDHGEDEANKRMVSALVASGKYKSDDGVQVELT